MHKRFQSILSKSLRYGLLQACVLICLAMLLEFCNQLLEVLVMCHITVHTRVLTFLPSAGKSPLVVIHPPLKCQ